MRTTPGVDGYTLGVDGDYTENVQVARAFTGWTIANPRQEVASPSSHACDDGEGCAGSQGQGGRWQT
jgi:hypothetical protein